MLDIKTLFDLIGSFTILLIPLVLGITEILKRMLPDSITAKYTPLISLVLSLISALLFIGFTRQAAVAGIVIGLSASGLWSGGKTVLGAGNPTPGTGNKGFVRLWELFLLWILALGLAIMVGCAGTSVKGNAVAAYEAIGGSITVVRATELELCETKAISAEDCARFDAVYAKARQAFIVAGDLLVVAINNGDAQSWSDYQAAMADATRLVPEVVALAAQIGILKGGAQ